MKSIHSNDSQRVTKSFLTDMQLENWVIEKIRAKIDVVCVGGWIYKIGTQIGEL